MRTHISPLSIALALCRAFCLALVATAACAADGPVTPPAAPAAPPVPPPAMDYTVAGTVPNPHEDVEAQAQDAARQRNEAAMQVRDAALQARAVAQQAALQARLDAARERMEVAAQQLAALSAQMSGPMVQHLEAFGGPPRALIGVQLARGSRTGGARVREVSPGGPAEQAGVRAGDVITAVNGRDVRGKEPARRVVELLHDVKPGDTVNLRVFRDGKPRDLTVTARPGMHDFFFATRPSPQVRLPDLPDLPAFKGLSTWGGPMIMVGPVADMELAKLTPGLGRYFGTDSGVLVVRAPPDGALGLQDGDVILSIDGRSSVDSSHVIRILSSYDPGDKMTLEVLRLHRKISVATTVPARPDVHRKVLLRNGGLIGPQPEGPGSLLGPGAGGPPHGMSLAATTRRSEPGAGLRDAGSGCELAEEARAGSVPLQRRKVARNAGNASTMRACCAPTSTMTCRPS